MASTAQQKLQAYRQKRGALGSTSARDKLRKYRARSVGKEEEDEDQDESFIDELVGLGERIWYGETEDPWFGRTDKEGRRQAPLMGEVRGKMGAEDILPYAAQFLESPYEKGIKPLAKLGYGLAKMDPFTPTTDPDVLAAQRVVSEGAESITGLARDPFAKDYYPVEGAMNVAALAYPGLKGLGLPKTARVASIVADPLTPAAGAGIRAARKGAAKAAPAVTKAKATAKKATAAVKDPFKDFYKDVKLEGRSGQVELSESIQSFFTATEPEFVNRLHVYAADNKLAQRMIDARRAPQAVIRKVQAKIKAYADKKQDDASAAFGRAKKAAISEYGDVGVSTRQDGQLPLTINGELIEFGGRLKVRWKEKVKKQDPKDPKKTVEVTVDREAVMNRQGDFLDKGGRLRTDIPLDDFKWDVEWIRKEATMADKANKKVREHLRDMLNSGETINGERSLSVQQGLTYVEKNNSAIKAMKANQRPAAKLSSRIRDAEMVAIREPLPENALAHLGEYNRHNKMLDQIEADFGVKPRMDDISRKKLTRSLESAFKGNEASANVDRLETLIGKEGVADLVGANHFGLFGGGLVVRSEISNIGRLAGRLVVMGGAGATAGIYAIPLLMFFSPRYMSQVAIYLGKHPTLRKVLTGRGKAANSKALQAIATNVRQIAQKLKGQNIDVKTVAAQGMTLGQLMQRLQTEEEQQQR